jgi:hypothetical protein
MIRTSTMPKIEEKLEFQTFKRFKTVNMKAHSWSQDREMENSIPEGEDTKSRSISSND